MSTFLNLLLKDCDLSWWQLFTTWICVQWKVIGMATPFSSGSSCALACSISLELTMLGKLFCIPLPRGWIWGKRRAALRMDISILSLNVELGKASHRLLLPWSLEQPTVATWFAVISVYICISPSSLSSPSVPSPIKVLFSDTASVIVK